MDTLRNEGLANQLLVGSRAVNTMMNDINEVVRMVIGALKRCAKSDFRGEIYVWTSIYDTEGKWVMYAKNRPGGKPEIRYELVKPSRALYTSDGKTTTSTSEVEKVYCQLDRLVRSVMEEFPEIERLWKPLLDASKVEF